ncbi:MAG: hypothetical protein AAF629_23925, partial [Chloroflexota bacterium]
MATTVLSIPCQASKMTQKKLQTFEWQTAIRLAEFWLIKLAMAELDDDVLWHYFGPPDDPFEEVDVSAGEKFEQPADDSSASSNSSTQQSATGQNHNKTDDDFRTGGTRICVFYDQNMMPTFEKVVDKKVDKRLRGWNFQFVEFLLELKEKVQAQGMTGDLPIFTEHKRKGQIFCGHPRSEGSWKDWIMIDWGKGWGSLPAQIW